MKNLFNKPVPRTIGGVAVLILQVPFERFEQAFVIGEWFGVMDSGKFDFEELRVSLAPGHERREALLDMLCACVQIPGDDDASPPRALVMGDLAGMPLIAVAEAVIEVMEVNADFFFQTLPKLLKAATRMSSIGSELSSSSLAPATGSRTSSGTPSANSSATSA